MVHPQVWEDVPDQKILEAIGAAHKSENGHGDGKTQVRQQDEMLVFLLVQWTAGQEVVDATIAVLLSHTLTLRLLLVVVVTRHILEQVQRPSCKLLAQEHGCGVDGGLFEQLMHLVEAGAHSGGVLLSGAWQEDHITLHVSSRLVVLAMTDLPAEVGDQ